MEENKMDEKKEKNCIYDKYDVAEIFNCSESKAANIIRGLNNKLLESKG